MNPFVIIVGAGPSGLLLALLLSKKGIPVRLVDLASGPDDRPRATHYAPPAVQEMVRAGVAKEARAQGFTPRTVAWRKLDGTLLASLDGSVLDGRTDRMICLPLDRLGKLIYSHLQQQRLASVSWNSTVIGIGQDEKSAWINIETPDGKETLSAPYIVGCDGANSQVRRSLFGDFEFPGRTWDQQIVATNVGSSLL